METAVSLFNADSWTTPRGGPVSICIPVQDESRIGEARRAADALAEELALDDETRGVLAVVVSEAVTNLARHAQNGSAFLQRVTRSGKAGVELLAVDHGPGMSDIARAQVDGFSTGGTSGHGLGAMRRLATDFDVHTIPGSGTVVVARVFPKSHEPLSAERIRSGVVCRPIDGEQACGDGWAIQYQDERTLVLMVDGLGHGVHAAAAADTARMRFDSMSANATPQEILSAIHETLRATRGAAALVCEIRPAASGATVTVAGVGNITASIVSPTGSRALPSVNGTAGHNVRNIREFSADWPEGALMIFATDGLTTRWRLDAYPGVLHRDPSIAAALLHRDHSRGRDDVTVLALAHGAATPR